jgi:hypothetical protein
MSYSKEMMNRLMKKELNKKNSQFNETNLISYIDDKKNKDKKQAEFYESMKLGYEEMAAINKEYAEYGATSDYYSFIEYEAWLFGV